MSQHSKDKIQKELEELSWAFMAGLKEPEKEEDSEFLIEEYGESLNQKDDDSNIMDDEIGSLYANNNHSYGLNDMGRNSGIIMDEDKLEAHKVTEWHRPDKIKETRINKFLKLIWHIIVWPISILGWLVSNFFRGVYLVVSKIITFLINLIKHIAVLSWEFVMAFGHVWTYLFGEVNWINRKKLAPVRVTSEISSRKKILKKAVAFVVLAICLVLPFQIYSIYYQANNVKGQVLGVAQEGLNHLQQASVAGTDLDFNKAGYEFNLAEDNFKVVKDEISELGLVANKIGEFIPDVKTGKELVEVADLTSQIGRHITEGLSWLSDLSSDFQIATVDDNSNNKEVNLIQANYEMQLALKKTEQVKNILEDINLTGTKFSSYSNEFNNLKNNLPQLISWLREGNEVISILNYILGMDEPRRLMLVFENNNELRPSGGFMGSYAIVDIKDAKIKNIDVPGGGFYDLKGSLTVKVDAPYPFHLFSPIWQPWNANWFYDWPTSAEKIEWFYEKSGGSSVDGVIAFTPRVIIDLLKIVGEIDMPEYEMKINADNFIKEVQTQVEFGYDKEENKPKKIIGDLLPKILEKLAALEDNQLMPVLQILTSNLKEKHLLVYFNNQDLQSKIKKLGWAGVIKNNPGDYLAVIHTNIAGGKTDGVINRVIKHEAEILNNGSIIDTVTLSETHNGQVDDIFEGQTNTDYLRFYVPQGSELISAQGFDVMPVERVFQEGIDIIPDSDLVRIEKNLRIDPTSGTRIIDEFGKTSFANWLTIAPGETKEVTIKYRLPIEYEIKTKKITEMKKEMNIWQLLKRYFWGAKQEKQINEAQTYSLLLQKQPGIDGDYFESQVKLDNDWKIADDNNQDGLVLWKQGVKFISDLKTDRYYKIKITN